MGRPEGESSGTPPPYAQQPDPGHGTIPATPYYDQAQQDQPYGLPPPAIDQPPPQHQTVSRAPLHSPPPPPGPVQFPPPSPQMSPAAPLHQPAAYPPPPTVFPPPQNPPPLEAYPPQRPAAYPPPSPQQLAQQYPPPPPPQVNCQPVQFPPAGNTHQVNCQPVQFPPAGTAQVGYGGQMPPQSPIKPAAAGIPAMPLPNTEGWRTGLFDCMEDPMNAIITFLFPCLTFGQIAEIIDNGQTNCATGAILYAMITSFVGMPCIYSCTYRTKLRSKFGLVEAPAPDWVVHFLCEACALCQAYRELNHRGLDPSLGEFGKESAAAASNGDDGPHATKND
ncbi:hypothetical protein CRG98_035709, partial [Punica granatum]